MLDLYRLELPGELSNVHPTFHVSNLRKCLADHDLIVPLDDLQVNETLHFVEKPVEIMDRQTKQLRHSRIPIVKVRWEGKRGAEFTWELECDQVPGHAGTDHGKRCLYFGLFQLYF